MTIAMQPIYTQTVGSGGATSITFNSIPQGFTDLKIVISLRSTGTNGTLIVQFNGDTTNTNYSMTQLYGIGYGGGSSARYSAPYFTNSNLSSYTSNTFSNGEIYVANYTAANFKQIMTDSSSENNATSAESWLLAGLWRNTAAITSIRLSQAIDTGFTEYSTFTLYGITKG